MTCCPGGKTVTCLEITAGQGTCLGWRLEHLAEIIDRVKQPKRLAVCLDTAHLFAAGYDFRGRKYAKFRKEIETDGRPEAREGVAPERFEKAAGQPGRSARSHRPGNDRARWLSADRAG